VGVSLKDMKVPESFTHPELCSTFSIRNTRRNMTQKQPISKKKTRHKGDEGTTAFWLYMKALYKDE
jgi:hypothetical protein